MRPIVRTIILSGLIAGCRDVTAPRADPVATRLDRIAIDYIHQHHPTWGDEQGLTRVVIDHGSYWEWTRQLPQGVAGGVPVVLIDKKDEHVIEAFHTQ